MNLPVGNENVTRYAYIFLDESGNFDFGSSGTRYLVLTSVSILRPSPMWGRLDAYKYHCIQTGTDVECFHCYHGRWPVRSAVFNLIAEHLDNIRISCAVSEKEGFAPEMREDKRLYPWMLGFLLRHALSEELAAGAEGIIVITDTIPVNRRRRAVEKSIKQAVVSGQLPKVTYRILHHQ
ncbi:MAG: hypothetical protein OXN89_21695 [Bryobacterales bacterium]|nr:hypothetical protein [Bryobacterales bacterium]